MVMEKIRKLAGHLLLESPGRSKTLVEWGDALQASGVHLAQRATQAQGDEAKNRLRLNHITGIERWAQRRLRVFLGQPPVRDEYDGYRPGESLGLTEQIAAFAAARTETVEIIRQLAEVSPESLPATVEHNQLGPLSLYAWLRYMDMHASYEGKRIR